MFVGATATGRKESKPERKGLQYLAQEHLAPLRTNVLYCVMPSVYDPELIEVLSREGTPKTVKYRKRLLQVKGILNVWRIDDEWWRKPISRLYYSVEFTSGSRLTIFRDLITGKWYRQNWA